MGALSNTAQMHVQRPFLLTVKVVVLHANDFLPQTVLIRFTVHINKSHYTYFSL